jgi:hypothetical protein
MTAQSRRKAALKLNVRRAPTGPPGPTGIPDFKFKLSSLRDGDAPPSESPGPSPVCWGRGCFPAPVPSGTRILRPASVAVPAGGPGGHRHVTHTAPARACQSRGSEHTVRRDSHPPAGPTVTHAQARLTRTRGLQAARSSIRSDNDTSSLPERRIACRFFLVRWHRVHTCHPVHFRTATSADRLPPGSQAHMTCAPCHGHMCASGEPLGAAATYRIGWESRALRVPPM